MGFNAKSGECQKLPISLDIELSHELDILFDSLNTKATYVGNVPFSYEKDDSKYYHLFRMDYSDVFQGTSVEAYINHMTMQLKYSIVKSNDKIS